MSAHWTALEFLGALTAMTAALLGLALAGLVGLWLWAGRGDLDTEPPEDV